MSRVALISDIHGNLVALEAVLDDLDRQQVDAIVCLGDVAATGPQPREAVDRVAALGCPVVRGNTDRFLLAPDDEDLGGGGPDLARILELDRWGAEQLDDPRRAIMAGYTDTVRHGDLLAFHGTPRSDTEQLRSTTPDDELAEMLAGHDAAVFAGGHTHAVMVRQLGAALVVNPGSVGLPAVIEADGSAWNPPWAEYAILDGRSFELRRVPVDVERILAAARASGMPHVEWWCQDWRAA